MARDRSFLPLRGKPLLRRLVLSEVLGPPRGLKRHTTPLTRQGGGVGPRAPVQERDSAPSTSGSDGAPGSDGGE